MIINKPKVNKYEKLTEMILETEFWKTEKPIYGAPVLPCVPH